MDFESMPYAPGGTGPLGHNHEFRARRMGMLADMARVNAPIVRLRLPFPGVRAAAALDPGVVSEVLVEKAKSFEKSDMLRFSLRMLAGDGLFTSNGDLWKRQRKLMAPLFTPKALEAYARDMVDCSVRTTSSWTDGAELRLLAETTRLTMGIAGKTLFEADTFQEADEIGHHLTHALEWTGWAIGRPFAVVHVMGRRLSRSLAEKTSGPPRAWLTAASDRLSGPLFLPGKRGRELRRAIRFLDDHVQKMIDARRHRRDGAPVDLLSRLLDARDEDGSAMSDRQVRDEVLTLFVAGHETTATGLAWTIYYACQHPEVYAALEREADAVGDVPTIADLPALTSCLRAFKEALRLMPPVYVFGRDTTEPVELGGYLLDKKTNVLVSPWVLHHAAHVWPDPARFDPDRFTSEAESKRSRHAYLPFGAGPRVCLGNHFAYMEAQLALAVLLRRYRFELLADDEPEPSATLRPKHGVRVRAFKR